MTKKIGILFSGGLKQFTRRTESEPESFSDFWKKMVEHYNADVFAYVDNNDFFYKDVQYFSENNRNSEVVNNNADRYHHTIQSISYDQAYPIIENILTDCFSSHLKNYKIMDYPVDNSNVYDKNNPLHVGFWNYSIRGGRNTFSKLCLLNQFYKLNECFKLLETYEIENNFKYDIIIRIRPDLKLLNVLDGVDLNTLDLTNTLYCSACPWHIYDWWALGNRSIMKTYTEYYNKYMSINLKYKVYLWLFNHKGRIFDWEIYDGTQPKKYQDNPEIEGGDASDSSEFGLHYLIGTLFQYQFNTSAIKMYIRKIY